MNDKRDWTALIITVCAVITAMPRWIGALLASEGFVVPDDWRHWWIVASAVFSAAMAITEGAAFAYVFNAWRNQKDKSADRLLWFAGASGVTFVVVLAPFIASQVRSESLKQMLNADWALWIWSSAVAASTIVIVASVGYAQKQVSTKQTSEANHKQVPIKEITFSGQEANDELFCPLCDISFTTKNALNAHKKKHSERPANVDVDSWRKLNNVVRNANWRAKRLGAKGEILPQDWLKVLNHYAPDGKCPSCGEIAPLHLDHVILLTHNGPNLISNVQPLCRKCNSSKSGTKDFRFDEGEFARNLHIESGHLANGNGKVTQ